MHVVLQNEMKKKVRVCDDDANEQNIDRIDEDKNKTKKFDDNVIVICNWPPFIQFISAQINCESLTVNASVEYDTNIAQTWVFHFQ